MPDALLDRELITELARRAHFAPAEVARLDEHPRSFIAQLMKAFWRGSIETWSAPPPADVDFGVRYEKLIHAAAQKHGVDEKLIAHVIAAESNFDPKAVSRKRALGLMQLLPETAAHYAVGNVFDPAQNIDGGTHYLKDLLARYSGNLRLALAAYNAGPEMVDRYGEVPPFRETQNYVRQILASLAIQVPK